MKFKPKQLNFGVIFILFAFVVILVLIWNHAGRWGAPYIDTAEFSKLEEKYNGFSGMELEKATQLLTKNGMFIIVKESDNLSLSEVIFDYKQIDEANKSGMSILCFPVQNSKSREECFIKGFLIDEHSTVVSQVNVQLSADAFFQMLKDSRGEDK